MRIRQDDCGLICKKLQKLMSSASALPPSSPFVAVIGGGPAGLRTAETLAKAGIKVTIYDRMPSMARKFLMAGRGGLNLTHSESLPDFVARYGKAADWMAPLITQFSPGDLRAWCEGLGQETFVGSSGRVFPKSLKASPLLRAWLRRLDRLGVTFAPRHEWRGWDAAGNLSFSHDGNLVSVHADAVLLALGGASWPRLGSDGGWADILRGEKIVIEPLRPANCGFVVPWSETFAAKFAGTPVKPVTLSFDGRNLQGEIMITQRGLEGGAIYALSTALRDAIDTKGKAILNIDLRPGLNIGDLATKLDAPRGSQSLSNWLRKISGLHPAAIGLLRESAGKDLPQTPDRLAALIKNAPIRLTATAEITRAISSAGGIARDELDDNFMLKKKPGVFIAGEMLDWEAPTGGYLLQGCFSTAVAAAKGITTYLGKAS
jgi:uncharacterized flavoprotein (TIGR03862 family)